MSSKVLDRSIPDPKVDPTLPVPRAAHILGISPRQAYRLVLSGDIPSIPVGKRTVVPTAKFLDKFGLSPAA